MATIRGCAVFAVLLLGSTALLSAQAATPPITPAPKAAAKASPAKHASHRKKIAKKARRNMTAASAPVAAPVPAQTLPPVPATLMNSPAVPSVVTLQDGQLSIDAPNSILSEVLNGVRVATGAAIEGPAPGERIAIKLGPGTPTQVLDALLQGTPYDYVILGAPDAPQSITRIVLSSRSREGGESAPPEKMFEPQNTAAGALSHRRGPDTPGRPDSMNPPQEPEDEPEPEAQPQQPETSESQPAQPDSQQPKSPEQLLREMRQMNQPQTPTAQPN